ncbi:MAG: ABC transporter ATP-binding protein [Angelakisella sp.]|jgi:oligopeptide transport system ATP-binding protein|nr:ABC transporter ATP-binding protein [Angelakisella sp.]MCI9528294.1 ABC transporter ATP-binding protein [Angelakisella sp.]
METLLSVQDLSISFHTYNGEVQAVREASFDLGRGEVLAIVGESGSGKSVMMQTILQLTPCHLKGGRILFDGEDITRYTDRQMQSIRGSQIGIIFQDAMTSLNPTMKIGRQITESLLRHQKLSRKEARDRALELLTQVGINHPEKRYHQYIHNLSGGMRQRVMIAIALACRPKLLIADEPTTALDVTIQAQIMDLLVKLREEVGCSIVLITHDLGVVAANADRIAVMYAGRVVETGSSDQIFYHSAHPYTRGLLESIPRLDAPHNARLTYIGGTPPDALNPAPGCAFSARCRYAMAICRQTAPAERELQPGHRCACFLLDDEAAETRQKTGWEVAL